MRQRRPKPHPSPRLLPVRDEPAESQEATYVEKRHRDIDENWYWGHALLIGGIGSWSFFTYAMFVAPFMPESGIWIIDAVKHDRHYIVLLPLLWTTGLIFVIVNWVSIEWSLSNAAGRVQELPSRSVVAPAARSARSRAMSALMCTLMDVLYHTHCFECVGTWNIAPRLSSSISTRELI